MIALDTNVVVRFLVRDDEKQSQIAFKRFQKAENEPSGFMGCHSRV